MAKDQLIAWLNDAYAMEKAQLKILDKHIKDFEDHEEIRSRLEEHVSETNNQCDRLQQCIESLGGKISGIKGATGTFMGTIQGLGFGAGGDDKLVKDAMADYAAEHYEIAMYETIKTAATELGLSEVAEMCDNTIHEEQDMADFLREQLPEAVTAVIQNAAGVEARPESETAETTEAAPSRTEPAFGERLADEDNEEDAV